MYPDINAGRVICLVGCRADGNSYTLSDRTKCLNVALHNFTRTQTVTSSHHDLMRHGTWYLHLNLPQALTETLYNYCLLCSSFTSVSSNDYSML
jgi:hypothetical protein